jgi:hypothetical protein
VALVYAAEDPEGLVRALRQIRTKRELDETKEPQSRPSQNI